MSDFRDMKKGERLPKHKVKVHNYMDSLYKAYSLLDENERVIAEVREPRHKGVARKLKEYKDEQRYKSNARHPQ